jgi:hypothetical protein
LKKGIANVLGVVVWGIVVWVVLTGFYFLFAGTLSLSEMIGGLPTAAVATGFALVLRRAETHRLCLKAPWLRVIGKPLGSVGPDAFRVGRVLLGTLWHRPAGPLGVVTRQPFRHGGDDPRSAGRRALVALGTSFAPNGYVLSSPDDVDALVLHRLMPVPPVPDRDWPL